MDTFNVFGNFLGLDYINDKKPLTFDVARSHGSKVWKVNFWANSEHLYISMSRSAYGFLLLKWKSYALSETRKIVFKKIGCFKKILNGWCP